MKISIKINGKAVLADAGKTILRVAHENGIKIPSLCFHPDIEIKHHCGMCLVKIDKENELVRACATEVKEGMEIITESEEINKERKNNLDKILSKHLLECDDCVWFQHCKLLELTKKFDAKPIATKKDDEKVFKSGTIVFDQTKCIGCENCIDVCPTGFLELDKNGNLTPSKDESKECINCGQCILHCPVGAIEGVGEFEELQKHFMDKNKVVVVQFAPSIRTSIGEEFGMKYGEINTGKLIAGLKQLGFDHVFDTAAGADFTTTEEAGELMERLQTNTKLPGFTSCCPAWVKYVEFYHPEFVPNLCTARSPQTMLGGIIKNYWAKENKIDPKDIFVVSIMPCVAKKYEIKREELKIDGIYPVDMVLTTRELVRFFKSKNIDLKNIEEQEIDNPLCMPSGAGVIYGSSGGVFESAFRTVYFKTTGKDLPEESVKEIRGSKGIKIKEFSLKGRKVRLCVVSGIKNAEKILKELKENPKLYDAVEVMACPGGCVGGGGQSLPTTKEIVSKRGASLYTIDSGKKVRKAHENPIVKKVYDEFFVDEAISQKVLHTEFSQKPKSNIDIIENSRKTE